MNSVFFVFISQNDLGSLFIPVFATAILFNRKPHKTRTVEGVGQPWEIYALKKTHCVDRS